MTISRPYLEELLSRLRLSQVVERRVRLKRAGREFSGLCPFHHEKSPSFTVNDDKGFYHCFGCSAHGDAVRFVMQTEGFSYPEAVEHLAAEAGMSPPPKPGFRDTADVRRNEAKRQRLRGLLEQAASWFEAQLRTPDGAAACEYLKARGLTGADAKRFGLGWAPDLHDALRLHLGATEEEMLEAGLSARSETGVYARFRRRIIFPIHDPRGRIVGFGGRVIGDGKPKYLNSPETILFDKGSLLYNFHRAAPEARKTGLLAVAEGYMDVVIPSSAGGGAIAAALGTALGERHLALCWSVTDRPVICFDGDGPGGRAAEKAAFTALPLLTPGKSLAFAALPDGMDPDEFVRARGGEAFVDFLRTRAEPLDAAVRRILFARHEGGTPEQLAARKKAIEETCALIRDTEIRSGYRNALLEAHYQEGRSAAAARDRNAGFEGQGEKPAYVGNARYGKSFSPRRGAAAPGVVVKMHSGALEQTEEGYIYRMAGLLAAFPRLLHDEEVNAEIESCASEFLDEVARLALESVDYTDSEGVVVSGVAAAGFEHGVEPMLKAARFFKNMLKDSEIEARAAWRDSAGKRQRKALEKEYHSLASDLTSENYEKATLILREIEALDKRLKDATA